MAPLVVDTTLEGLHALGEEVRAAIARLLEHSSLRYHDINAGSDVIFVGRNSWRWGPLDADGRAVVKPARDVCDRWRALSVSAISVAAPEREQDFTDEHAVLDRVIQPPDDSAGAPGSTIEAVRNAVMRAIATQTAVIDDLPSAHGPDERLVVADTSALLDRPALQDWMLDGLDWTVIAVPQVLAELDERKRDSRTRDAANKVISQLTDFDRRGDTLVGVPISGRISYREVATSPDMDRSLPWLRPDVPDDQIIAAALELAWQNLNARVTVLASDRNVRNKARIAGLPTLTPEAL